MAKKKNSSKDVMLPHSDAKVTFYEKYLERYLAIMSVQKWYRRVNIFDVYCGRGNDLCRCGGADTRNVRGRTFQYRRADVCSRIYGNDDFGYHFRIIQSTHNDKSKTLC